MYDGPVIDTHVHLQLDDDMQMVEAEHRPNDYLAAATSLDLRAAGVLVMAPAGQLDVTEHRNDLVLALAADPAWYPMCSVHPADGDDALTEIDRVAEMGARGLKLHPTTQKFDVADEGVIDVVRHAGDRGLPVLFDSYSPSDANEPGKFAEMATDCPETKIVLAHMLGPRFPELIIYQTLSQYPWWPNNVWFDVSWAASKWSKSPFSDQYSWICRQMGVDRLLFGSDFPIDDPVQALTSLELLSFNDDETAAIAHDNAAALYGLDS